MSLCHKSPARDRSKRRGSCDFSRLLFILPLGNPLPLRALRTLLVLTLTPAIRPRKFFTFLKPKSGFSCFTFSMSSRTPFRRGRPPGFLPSRALGPPVRYFRCQLSNVFSLTPHTFANSRIDDPDFIYISTAWRRSSGLNGPSWCPDARYWLCRLRICSSPSVRYSFSQQWKVVLFIP